MLKGALHIHSTYSDGEFSLTELRQIFMHAGCSFVCMTDHAESFDEAKLKAYLDECQACSDDKLRLVAGLEYECEKRMHILGYGAEFLTGNRDPQAVIREIDEQRAISVIAHPKTEHFPWIESFTDLPDGIEVWNSKYDGRYAPRPETFALLGRLIGRKPQMRAFYGQDLHWEKQFRGLFIQLECTSLQTSDILRALSSGRFHGQKGELELPASGALPLDLVTQFARAHSRSHRVWKVMKASKELLDQTGLRVPDSIKTNLRRLF